MQTLKLTFIGFFIFSFIFVSCGSAPRVREAAIPEAAPVKAPASESFENSGAPQKPWREIPAPPELILGRGSVDSQKLAEFLLTVNPEIDGPFAYDFAKMYVEEAAVEGVNHDIAFSQMCLETGFLSFGGLVKPDMNNFCGLGALGPGYEGESFPSPQIGVRAQIQHLKAYATEEPPKQALVDPRYRWVRYGSAPTIYGLAGSWASDREYGKKIKNILDNLYAVAYGS
ncbi:MAG: glucosaminidase domain-containing protein [Spirochaetaceae bacterium]|jgi:hypothetical protein|nr:glucosaminidase domain-containing protein [Spirochaetaceae bacterium]